MSENFIYQNLSKSLLNIPPTILSHFDIKINRSPLPENMTLNIKGCSKLVLFMIDGMGINVFDKFANKNFFKLFREKGKINKITSVFPPTTPAALTTMHTGLAPIEHGFLEWYLYMSSIEEIIESLPYKIVDTEFTDTKVKLPQDSTLIFNGKTIYETLKENRVGSVIFLPENLSSSIYARATSKNAKVIGYKDLEDLLDKLVYVLESSNSKLFCNVYWRGVDKTEHAYGVWTQETKKEVEELSKHLEMDFLRELNLDTAVNTGIFFTADHGQEDIDLENVTLLNNHNYLTERYEINSKGNPILPTGNPRDIFLHIKSGKVDEVISYLEKLLGNKSIILKLDKPTIKRLFGDFRPHRESLERMGNVLILSAGPHVCWYEYNSNKKLTKKGHHGSLLASEMMIPFGSVKASDLLLN